MKKRIIMLLVITMIVFTSFVGFAKSVSQAQSKSDTVVMGSIKDSDTLAARLILYRPDELKVFIRPIKHGGDSLKTVFLIWEIQTKNIHNESNHIRSGVLFVTVDGLPGDRHTTPSIRFSPWGRIAFNVNIKKNQQLEAVLRYKNYPQVSLHQHFSIDWKTAKVIALSNGKNNNVFTKN